MADGSSNYRHVISGGNSRVHAGNTYNTTTYNYGSPGGNNSRSPEPQQPTQARAGPQQRGKQDYTVGWICALPNPELRASRLLLDEEHDNLELATNHQYVYGSMNGHNIVMGCLPRSQTGKGAAASVASEMKITFPALRFGLLVGVAGGVPSKKHDIRLGDVVVGEPDREKRYGGVVQYDYGKLIQGQGFVQNGYLSQPPEILLSGLGKVQSTPITKPGRFFEYLDLYEEDQYDDFPGFPLDGALEDKLYPPNVLHPNDCDQCDDESSQIVRKPRRAPTTRVHYGSIASGDELMKDAIKRDEIGEQYDVLCFEMEAAGLMNVFPCLVIRGICDYCDSHKNKSWQPFAAAAAAAWAKEFLRNIPPAQVGSEATIGSLTQQPREYVQPPSESSRYTQPRSPSFQPPYQPNANRRDNFSPPINQQRQPNIYDDRYPSPRFRIGEFVRQFTGGGWVGAQILGAQFHMQSQSWYYRLIGYGDTLFPESILQRYDP